MLLYIDPGSGSIILQLIIAGVTGSIFTMATLKNKIKALMVTC
jgi:hypothetical protein